MMNRAVIVSAALVAVLSGCAATQALMESYKDPGTQAQIAASVTMTTLQSKLSEADKLLVRQLLQDVKSILLLDENKNGSIKDVFTKAMEPLKGKFQNQSLQGMLLATLVPVLEAWSKPLANGEGADPSRNTRVVVAALDGALSALPQPVVRTPGPAGVHPEGAPAAGLPASLVR